MSGEGRSHRLTRRASAKAAKTRCGAAARRWRTSTRVSSAGPLPRGPPQKPVELDDRPRPERPMARDPARRIVEWLPAQSKPMDAPVDRALDQPGSLEHLQVFRDSRLGGAELPT